MGARRRRLGWEMIGLPEASVLAVGGRRSALRRRHPGTGSVWAVAIRVALAGSGCGLCSGYVGLGWPLFG